MLRRLLLVGCWYLLHEDVDLCRETPSLQMNMRRVAEPGGRLVTGRQDESLVSFVIEEYWSGEAFTLDGAAVVTEVADGRVSGFVDGTTEGPLFDALEGAETNIWATFLGFAWSEVPGEHL